jgi:hypothetical protein
MLSIVVVTNRPGGMDALFAGLLAQTHRNFELVIVDELTERHADKAWPTVAFPYHCRSPLEGPRWGNYMRSLNVGLASSTGDRLVFWSDYTCPHPETLATHTRFQEEHPDEVMLGGIEYTELPPLHPRFPLKYGWLAMGHDVANPTPESYAPWLDDKRRHELYEEWRVAYEADLDSGALDPFMWSVFEKPVTSWDDVKDLRVFNHDKRDTSPFLNLKNDSIPRGMLEKIGGFDERADGCHGHQDSITWRQLEKVGAKLRVRAENPVKLLDPHGICIARRMTRPDDSNLKIYEAAQ